MDGFLYDRDLCHERAKSNNLDVHSSEVSNGRTRHFISAERRYTAQKMKFPIKDFFSKCDQIRRNLRI